MTYFSQLDIPQVKILDYGYYSPLQSIINPNKAPFFWGQSPVFRYFSHGNPGSRSDFEKSQVHIPRHSCWRPPDR